MDLVLHSWSTIQKIFLKNGRMLPSQACGQSLRCSSWNCNSYWQCPFCLPAVLARFFCCPFCRTLSFGSIASSLCGWFHSFPWICRGDELGCARRLWWNKWRASRLDPAKSDQSRLFSAARLWNPPQRWWEEVPPQELSALTGCTTVLTAANCSHTGKYKSQGWV